MIYIHQHTDWPKFRWQDGRLTAALSDVRHRQGRLIGRMEGLGFELQAEAVLVNHGNHIGAVISLYKALGGGWDSTPVEALIPEDTRRRMRERTDWGDLLSAPLPQPPTGPSATSGVSRQ